MLMLLFILGAVGMRFLPHAWNFTPVIAMLLLAGTWMSRKRLWIPLAALVGSDVVLNLWVYHTSGGADQYFTWAAYLMVLGVAMLALRGRRIRVAGLMGTTVLSSALFFVVSNFGVWVATEMYPHTLGGLITCYAMGVPFYRTAAVGDLLYAAVFFGAYAAIRQRIERRNARLQLARAAA